MLRRVNDLKYFYLCQSADWQIIVESENEECAATLAVENIMEHANSDEDYSLSVVIAVKKLTPNMIEISYSEEIVSFYSPTILANAGFHAEASILHKYLEEKFKNE